MNNFRLNHDNLCSKWIQKIITKTKREKCSMKKYILRYMNFRQKSFSWKKNYPSKMFIDKSFIEKISSKKIQKVYTIKIIAIKISQHDENF